MRTTPSGVVKLAATMPGVPLGATHSTSRPSSGCPTGAPSHCDTRLGSPAISRPSERDPVARGGRRVMLGTALPLHEERQLRVGLQALHAELAPAQLETVRSVPVSLYRLALKALLDGGDVVDRDHPSEPAAAGFGAGAYCLAERRLVGGRVVEHFDDLEVLPAGQGEHHVAGAEPRVDAAVAELLAEQLRQSLGRAERARRGRLQRRRGRGAWQPLWTVRSRPRSAGSGASGPFHAIEQGRRGGAAAAAEPRSNSSQCPRSMS